MNFKQPTANSQQPMGFTLIESMIAVTILSLAVAGPLFVASRAIVATRVVRDQLTASYLAQEGIEYIRAMRDTAYLTAVSIGGTDVSSAAWTSFLTGTDATSITQCRASTCMLEPTRSMGTGSGFSLQPCSENSCTLLYLANNGTTNFYTQRTDLGNEIPTPFTRTVQVKDVPNLNDEKQIVSMVSWSYHGIPYAVTVHNHLTPWQ